MLLQIITYTPVWVWALLAALLALGLWQRRTRRVRPAQLLALPLVLLALGLWSMAPNFGALPLAAAAWLAALAGAAWLGTRLAPPRGTRWLAEEGRLLLQGSWLPLLLIVTIFSLRYASSVGLALHPEWRRALAVQLPLALAFGTLSGLFLGRALGLRRLARVPATMPGHEGPAERLERRA